MNVSMTREEYEKLPFRDDWEGDYRKNQYYRAKAYPETVFKWVGTNYDPDWWAFGIRWRD